MHFAAVRGGDVVRYEDKYEPERQEPGRERVHEIRQNGRWHVRETRGQGPRRYFRKRLKAAAALAVSMPR